MIDNPFEPTQEKEIAMGDIKIPECCLDDDAEDCPHIAAKDRIKKTKDNVGL